MSPPVFLADDLDDAHHVFVLMVEGVAVIDEAAVHFCSHGYIARALASRQRTGADDAGEIAISPS